MICMNFIYMDCICIHCIVFLLGTVGSEVLDQRSRVVCARDPLVEKGVCRGNKAHPGLSPAVPLGQKPGAELAQILKLEPQIPPISQILRRLLGMTARTFSR